MTLLVPLGLLGLIGIVILIIIYIIKPNYQQKYISTTYVWKLSLKYRKRKIPTSKLRNIILILCQVLILTICAAILAQPAKVLKQPVQEREVIAIIDSSASMRAKWEAESRFERAVNGVLTLSEEVFEENGKVSVILADEKPEYLAQRLNVEKKIELEDALNPLLEKTLMQDTQCAYGEADVEGAMGLCETVLEENPDAQIYFYTDATYAYVPQGVNIVNVANAQEWNAAILNAYTETNQNYYTFVVDIACYGRNAKLDVTLTVNNANAADKDDTNGATIVLESSELAEREVFCEGDVTKRLIFINEDFYEKAEIEEEDVIYCLIPMNDRVFAYNSVHISVVEETGAPDSFPDDDNFNIYGGQKEVLKVQYASSMPNNFFSGIIYTLQSAYADRWAIQFVPVKQGEAPALENFDFYIFEHTMPETMPKDGIVLLVNPPSEYADAGVRMGNVVGGESYNKTLTKDIEHPILKNITAEDITLSQHTRFISYDPTYQPLLSCDGIPVLLMKDEPAEKVMIMGFSLHYSNLPIEKSFPILMHNIFSFYLPTMVTGNAFEVGQSITIDSRCEEVAVTHKDGVVEINPLTEFPATLTVNMPGTYNLSQTTFAGKLMEESIYVKIPASESNIRKIEDALDSPYKEIQEGDFYDDLLLYFAAALVALLFIEWWLQSRDNM